MDSETSTKETLGCGNWTRIGQDRNGGITISDWGARLLPVESRMYVISDEEKVVLMV